MTALPPIETLEQHLKHCGTCEPEGLGRRCEVGMSLELAGDRKPREPGCICTLEEGDNPCPVHGEDEEDTRQFYVDGQYVGIDSLRCRVTMTPTGHYRNNENVAACRGGEYRRVAVL